MIESLNKPSRICQLRLQFRACLELFVDSISRIYCENVLDLFYTNTEIVILETPAFVCEHRFFVNVYRRNRRRYHDGH